jgi:hypothetical protein
VIFQEGAPLVGQSEHLLNFQVGIEDTESLSQLTFLANYASERVTFRGSRSPVYPDAIEEPGLRIDIVLRQGVRIGGVEAEFNLEARNIFETGYSETQDYGEGGRIDVNSYEMGARLSAGLSLRF